MKSQKLSRTEELIKQFREATKDGDPVLLCDILYEIVAIVNNCHYEDDKKELLIAPSVQLYCSDLIKFISSNRTEMDVSTGLSLSAFRTLVAMSKD